MSEIVLKHVEFDKWCGSCKYENIEETELPCNECLDEPVNEYSHKPVRWEAKDSEAK